MKINITGYGLEDALDYAKNYLESAMNEKTKKYKDDYINKAYGTIVAINSLIKVEDEDQIGKLNYNGVKQSNDGVNLNFKV